MFDMSWIMPGNVMEFLVSGNTGDLNLVVVSCVNFLFTLVFGKWKLWLDRKNIILKNKSESIVQIV